MDHYLFTNLFFTFFLLFTHCLHHFVVNDHASAIVKLSVDHHDVVRAELSEQVFEADRKLRHNLRKKTNANKSAWYVLW